MSEPWCKGNYAHGNACGQCSRCKERLETIISESRRHKSERNALSVRALRIEEMIAVLTPIAKRLPESRAEWEEKTSGIRRTGADERSD